MFVEFATFDMGTHDTYQEMMQSDTVLNLPGSIRLKGIISSMANCIAIWMASPREFQIDEIPGNMGIKMFTIVRHS